MGAGERVAMMHHRPALCATFAAATLVIASFAAGCSGGPADPATTRRAPTASPGDNAAAQLSGHWVLTEIHQYTLPSDVWIIFYIEPGKISGFSGCNRFEAPLQVDGNRLTVGVLPQVNQTCSFEAMEAEVQFLRNLERVAGFTIESDGTLTLTALDFMLLRAKR